MKKTTVLCVLLTLVTSQLTGQVGNYVASPSQPFGKANPAAPQEVKDFGPMIGRSDCKSETRNQDGTWADPINMTWTFSYIMDGMAVQDETIKDDGRHSGSIRQYSADSARWYVHYYASASPAVNPLPAWEGNLSSGKDKIVLYREQKAPNGMDGFFRLTFSNFSSEGYDWIGEWVDKAENITFPTWKISCKKRED